jgi:hypothetical protein
MGRTERNLLALDAGALLQPRRHFIRDRAGHRKIVHREQNGSALLVRAKRQRFREEISRHAFRVGPPPAVAVQPHRIIRRDVNARDADGEQPFLFGRCAESAQQQRQRGEFHWVHGLRAFRALAQRSMQFDEAAATAVRERQCLGTFLLVGSRCTDRQTAQMRDSPR